MFAKKEEVKEEIKESKIAQIPKVRDITFHVTTPAYGANFTKGTFDTYAQAEFFCETSAQKEGEFLEIKKFYKMKDKKDELR